MGLIPCSPAREDRSDGVLSPGRPPRIPRSGPKSGATTLATEWRKSTLTGDVRHDLLLQILWQRRPSQIGYASLLAPGRPDLVEDLVQDAQIATLLALRAWRPGVPFAPAFEEREAIWNAYVRWWRPSHDGGKTAPSTVRETKRAFRRHVLHGDLAPAIYPPARPRDPFAPKPVDWRRLGAQVMKAAGALLNPRDVRILEARFFEDQTLADVARREGISKERVRQLEHRALKDLRTHLSHLSPWGDGRPMPPPNGQAAPISRRPGASRTEGADRRIASVDVSTASERTAEAAETAPPVETS